MSDDGSITLWLGRLKDGDGDAVERIWREYFPRLVALARAKLRDMPRRAADEEDAALSAFDSFCRAAERSDDGWAEVVGTAPTPEFAAQAAEEYGRLLARLASDEFRSIAVWKMEGLTNAEIADRLGCALSSVDRRLRIIRKTWETELGEPAADSETP